MDFPSRQHRPITPSFGGREWDAIIILIHYLYVTSSLQSLQTNKFWKCYIIIHVVNLHALLMTNLLGKRGSEYLPGDFSFKGIGRICGCLGKTPCFAPTYDNAVDKS